jgi:hypothetical protein
VVAGGYGVDHGRSNVDCAGDLSTGGALRAFYGPDSSYCGALPPMWSQGALDPTKMCIPI